MKTREKGRVLMKQFSTILPKEEIIWFLIDLDIAYLYRADDLNSTGVIQGKELTLNSNWEAKEEKTVGGGILAKDGKKSETSVT
jgi:hypothetical protein